MSEQHTVTEWLEFGDTELECEIEFTFYAGDPGKYYGRPEIELNKLLVCTHKNTKGKKVFVDMTALLDNNDFADYVESKLWDTHNQYLNDSNDRDIESWQEPAQF